MTQFYGVLKSIALFEDISEKDLERLLKCLDARISSYQKDDIIFLTGDTISQVGIVLSGNIQVIKEDFSGNRTILTGISTGGIFGETFACAEITKSPVTVFAATRSEVFLFDYKKIISTCTSACVFHTRLIENMLKLLASKNLMLNQKIEIISKRTTREKLMAYLTFQAEKAKSGSFEIPFTRHELADFLCVDRSSMSRELSKMRDEGMLEFHGNRFVIH